MVDMQTPEEGGEHDELDEMIKEITCGALGDDEQFRAFRQAFEDNVVLPADGFVIGKPISVTAVDYDGNNRRGLTARCCQEDGSESVIALFDVVLPQASAGARYMAAYRKWLNLDPYLAEAERFSRHKVADGAIDLSKPVELVALTVKQQTARCRLPGNDRIITLRASGLWKVVPGALISVMPRKQWRYSGHPYLSGEIRSIRINAKALGLVPLVLEDVGMWDPEEEYRGEEDESVNELARAIIARGPRPLFEMEHVLPGEDLEDPFNDPITRAYDLENGGDRIGAIKILMDLCQADLRCLDAHSHLGNFAFDHWLQEALGHYEVGMRIGELSLGDDFTGVLPWGFVDNRPFLRCMHGYGLCLWRLERFEEAEHIFQKMLWLTPSDNQRVGLLIDNVKEKIAWKESLIHKKTSD